MFKKILRLLAVAITITSFSVSYVIPGSNPVPDKTTHS